MKNFLLFLFGLSLISSASNVNAQNQSSDDWSHIFLKPTGNNEIDGVLAWFKQVNCDGEQVVLLKLQNTNPFTVVVNWSEAVFKRDLSWINKEEQIQHIQIPADETVEGKCTDSNVLKIELSKFVDDPKEFKRFSTNGFAVQPLK